MAIPLILKREHVLCAAQTGNVCFLVVASHTKGNSMFHIRGVSPDGNEVKQEEQTLPST